MVGDEITSRSSGTVQRAPIFEGIARGLAERFESLVRRKTLVLSELDIKGAIDLGVHVKTARELEFGFARWQTDPPPGDERLRLVMRLRELEDLANEMRLPLLPAVIDRGPG